MAIVRTVAGLLLVACGAVFALQGANVITGSAVMSGVPRWTYIGIALIVFGLATLFWAFRARRIQK
jgi:hypothetical protein